MSEYEEELGTVDDDDDDDDEKLFLLLVLYSLHFLVIVCAISWIYPPDEPPQNARMRPLLNMGSENSRRTGETVLPRVHMSVPDIARLNRHDLKAPFRERGYLLSEDEQTVLQVLRDGDVHLVRCVGDLRENKELNYGKLIFERAPVELDVSKSMKDLVEPANDAIVETLAPLKRPRALEKEKKRKNKERMDALDKLTRGESKEHQTAFKLLRIPSRHGGSRRTPRAPSTSRIPEPSTTPSADDDGGVTLQKPRKVSAVKGFTNLAAIGEALQPKSPAELNKKSVAQREKEEPTLARTVEDPATIRKAPI